MIERISSLGVLVDDLDSSQQLFSATLGFETLPLNHNMLLGSREVYMSSGSNSYLRLIENGQDTIKSRDIISSMGPGPCMITFETDDYDDTVENFISCGIYPIDTSDESEDAFTLFRHRDLNDVLLEVRKSGYIWANEEETKANCGSTVAKRTIGLRQIAIVVKDIDLAIAKWSKVFQTKVSNRFETSFTDLDIAILPIGDRTTFVEIAQPTSDNSSAANFLRNHGEGIYLTIYEIKDSLAMDDLLLSEGVNFTSSRSTANYTNMGFNSIWIHPKFMHGMFIQLSEVLSEYNPWPPAGENWYQ